MGPLLTRRHLPTPRATSAGQSDIDHMPVYPRVRACRAGVGQVVELVAEDEPSTAARGALDPRAELQREVEAPRICHGHVAVEPDAARRAAGEDPRSAAAGRIELEPERRNAGPDHRCSTGLDEPVDQDPAP